MTIRRQIGLQRGPEMPLTGGGAQILAVLIRGRDRHRQCPVPRASAFKPPKPTQARVESLQWGRQLAWPYPRWGLPPAPVGTSRAPAVIEQLGGAPESMNPQPRGALGA